MTDRYLATAARTDDGRFEAHAHFMGDEDGRTRGYVLCGRRPTRAIALRRAKEVTAYWRAKGYAAHLADVPCTT